MSELAACGNDLALVDVLGILLDAQPQSFSLAGMNNPNATLIENLQAFAGLTPHRTRWAAWASRQRRRAVKYSLPLLLLAYFCNTLLWGVVTRIGHPPDEFSHFDYIRHIAINHSLPVYGQTRYVFDPAQLQRHASMPPLYYLLCTPIQMALSNASVTQQILALWVFTILLGAFTVWLVYSLGRLLVPARPAFALAAAALVGFNPMFTHLSASVNSDNLINLIYAALVVWLAKGLLKRVAPQRVWLRGLGALLGAGLITKQTILMGGVVSACVLLWLAWQQPGRRVPVVFDQVVDGFFSKRCCAWPNQ